MVSAFYDKKELVQILIDNGADIHHKDSVRFNQFGKTAYDRAKRNDVKLLLNQITS